MFEEEERLYRIAQRRKWCPERKLLLAILERAILDLCSINKYCKRGEYRMLRTAILNWVNRTDYSITGYCRICDEIGLPYSFLRDDETRRQVVEYYATCEYKRKRERGL